MICNMISRGELNPWVIYPQILESPILVVCQLGVCLFPCLFLQFALLLFEYVFQSGGFDITDSSVVSGSLLGLSGGVSIVVASDDIFVVISGSCGGDSDGRSTVGGEWCLNP